MKLNIANMVSGPALHCQLNERLNWSRYSLLCFVCRVNAISSMAGTIMSTIFIGILDLQTETPVVWKKSKSKHQEKNTCTYQLALPLISVKLWPDAICTMVWHRNDNYPFISLSIYLSIYLASYISIFCHYISIGRCCALKCRLYCFLMFCHSAILNFCLGTGVPRYIVLNRPLALKWALYIVVSTEHYVSNYWAFSITFFDVLAR